MTVDSRLQRLSDIADMKRARDMARLSQLARARDATRAKLAQLTAPMALTEDPALFAARQAHLAWANSQRMRLNQTLATQSALLLEQRRTTARSFSRAEMLARLAERPRQPATHSP